MKIREILIKKEPQRAPFFERMGPVDDHREKSGMRKYLVLDDAVCIDGPDFIIGIFNILKSCAQLRHGGGLGG